MHPEPEAEPDRASLGAEWHQEMAAESAADQSARVRADLSAALAAAREAQQIVGERERQAGHQAQLAGYDVALGGVVATLTWVLGQRPEAPFTGRQFSELTRDQCLIAL